MQNWWNSWKLLVYKVHPRVTDYVNSLKNCMSHTFWSLPVTNQWVRHQKTNSPETSKPETVAYKLSHTPPLESHNALPQNKRSTIRQGVSGTQETGHNTDLHSTCHACITFNQKKGVLREQSWRLVGFLETRARRKASSRKPLASLRPEVKTSCAQSLKVMENPTKTYPRRKTIP